MAKVQAGKQAQWELIEIGLEDIGLTEVILCTINEREILILSNTVASPLCYYDTKADTWRSAENFVKWAMDVFDENMKSEQDGENTIISFSPIE